MQGRCKACNEWDEKIDEETDICSNCIWVKDFDYKNKMVKKRNDV